MLSCLPLYTQFDIPLILYDQIGNGLSTHLPEKKGDEEFWTEDLFHRELENLLAALKLDESGYDLIGHSWGGMMVRIGGTEYFLLKAVSGVVVLGMSRVQKLL